MNWIRCFRVLVIATVVVAFAHGGAALTTDGDTPNEIEAGESLDQTITIDELHQNPQVEQWTLKVGTSLTDAEWTLTYLDQAGDEIKQTSHQGQNITSDTLSTENNIDAVEVRVRGTVPEPSEFTYPDEETVTVMQLTQSPDNDVTNDFATIDVHAYTEESKEARENLDAANDAIESANDGGADVSEAESTFQSAVSSYEEGNFENANRLAQQAEENANSKVKSSQQTQTILYAVGGLVVLLVIGGGAYWYRAQQDSYDKLG